MDLIALLVFVATIAAAFIFKVNSGIISIAVCLVVGRIAGVSDSQMISWFSSSLFIMLLGVMYLFCIAQENKTLELLAKKILSLCHGKVKLFPLILFLIAAVFSAIGPGLISVTALISAITVALAKACRISPIKLLPFGTLGSFAGGLSPITPSGIVAIGVSSSNGIEGVAFPLFWKMALTNVLYAAILYFFVFRWHRFRVEGLETEGEEKTERFNSKQLLTLLGIAVVAALSTFFKVNVGLAAFAVATVLTVLGCADEGSALKKVPWNTLVMITGVGILISLVTELGGIDLLSKTLSSFIGAKTAEPIITFLAGVMSWFSSASGVVMPTLIPTVPALVASMEGLHSVGLVVGICIGAHLAALSPLSSCGALMLSAYSTSGDVSAKERNRMFGQLFAMSACGVGFGAILAAFGLY